MRGEQIPFIGQSGMPCDDGVGIANLAFFLYARFLQKLPKSSLSS